MLAHLHNHTDYSFLDGMMTPKMLIAAAEEVGAAAVAITDHGEVSGHIDFMDAASKSQVKPIYGYEGYHWVPCQQNDKRKPHHLTLWAKNQDGLQNLWALASDVYAKADSLGHKRPLMTIDTMRKYGEGIIAGSACMSGALARCAKNNDYESAIRYLALYRDIFDDFYIELHTNSIPEQRTINMWLAKFAEDMGVPVIYAIDAHYASKDDAPVHDAYMGIQFHRKSSEQTETYAPDYYLMSEEEVRSRLSYLGGSTVDRAFDGVGQLVYSLSFDISVDRSRKIPTPTGVEDSDGTLVAMVREGLERKIFRAPMCDEMRSHYAEYIERLNYELGVIITNGLANYFLVVSDYTRWAKQRMLVGAGRGSAAGSLVCYLLDITEIDPIKAGLYFERFLNEGRMDSLPDIDLDFPDDMRGMVEEYLRDKYGDGHVASIGTIGRFKVKGALKDAAFYFGMDFQESNTLTSLVDTSASPDADFDLVLDDIPNQERLNWYRSQWKDVFRVAKRIQGLARQSSKHAAGVIISPIPLANALPLRVRDGRTSTQFDMHAAENLGFLKVDILGLRTLSTLTQMNMSLGGGIDFYGMKDSDDGMDKAFEMLSRGDTLGVFQLESDGMTGLCRSMKPRSVDDLSVAVALYRPGILDAGMLDVYLRRRSGEEQVAYEHPKLEPILGDTHGVMVYQEQVMRICQDLAGYTMVEADNMRSIIGKKKLDKMAEERTKFVDGCVSNDINRTVAESLFDNIEAFGRYSFNRAHSYAYGMIAMWTAWAKANYPVEYMAALMNTDPGSIPAYLAWCRRNGIPVLPPSVNRSELNFSVDGSGIRFGLLGVKHVGEAAAAGIISQRPYSSFDDFVSRVPGQVNKRVVEVLIDSGAMSDFDVNRPYLKHWFSLVKKTKDGRTLPPPTDIADVIPDYSEYERSVVEQEMLGMSLTVDPFADARARLGELSAALGTLEALEPEDSGIIMLRIDSVREHTTKGGSKMAFIDVTDSVFFSASITALPPQYAASASQVRVGSIAVVEVVCEDYRGKKSYRISKFVPITDRSNNG